MKVAQYVMCVPDDQILSLLPGTEVLGASVVVRRATGTIQIILGVLEPASESPREARVFRCFYPDQEVPDGYAFSCIAMGAFTGYVFEKLA